MSQSEWDLYEAEVVFPRKEFLTDLLSNGAESSQDQS